jgi:hypothetical protein
LIFWRGSMGGVDLQSADRTLTGAAFLPKPIKKSRKAETVYANVFVLNLCSDHIHQIV